MPRISDAGLLQLAEDSAKRVRVFTPRRGAAAIIFSAACAPARWPAVRVSPRAVPQRPLPSEMIATWSAGGTGMGGSRVATSAAVSRCGMFFVAPGLTAVRGFEILFLVRFVRISSVVSVAAAVSCFLLPSFASAFSITEKKADPFRLGRNLRSLRSG